MAFDCQKQRKPILYADLFKVHKNTVLETKQPRNTVEFESILSSSSSSNSIQSSFCDSFSSGFSTPFDSELCSSESDDGDFTAKLTCQMAECMLQEEEVTELDEQAQNSLPIPPLQVLQLKNQHQVSIHGGRFNGAESTQQKQFHKTVQQHHMQYRGRGNSGFCPGSKLQIGSGMQAIFLGGSGSKNGSSGTGVFLPRMNTDPNELKRKSGCSTVLIPTRVLHALEIHFNGHSNSPALPLIGGCGSSDFSYSIDESILSNKQPKIQISPTKHEEEMQLPQEWTY